MNVSRRRYMGEKGGSIPYQRIEYLESDGSQQILLPLSVQASDYFEVGGEIIITGKSGTFFSANPSGQFTMAAYSYDANTLTITTWSGVGNDTNDGGYYLTRGAKTSFALSTTFKRTKETITPLVRPLTMNINGFALYRQYSEQTGAKVAFGSFYIKVNDTLIYDLIPVRIERTGYMYDKISGELFGNDGTGDFKLGLDVGSKELLYYWDATDNLVDGKWIDRVKGREATQYNTVSKVDGMYELQASDYSPQKYFTLSNLNSGNTKIYLPAAWKCECEFMIPSNVVIGSGKSCMIFDFGSLTKATHAFSVNYTASGMGANYKVFGNSSNSVYGLASSIPIELGTLIHLELGTNYINESEVLLYMKIGNNIVYGNAPSPAMLYDNNWSAQNGYFGTGHATSYAGGKVYLKSLKLFSNI